MCFYSLDMFQVHYKSLKIGLSKEKGSEANPRTLQQSHLTSNIDCNDYQSI